MENWKQLKNYPNYLVSDKGRVKSIKYCSERILKQHSNRTKNSKRRQSLEYMKVMLCREGKIKNKYVHRLVVEAFIGEIPKDCHVDHIDDNSLSNILSNLRIIKAKENTSLKGEKNNKSKLTEKQVLEIRDIGRTKTLKEISTTYSVSFGTISHILKRRTWTHI